MAASTHTSEIPSDVAQVRPLLLEDHTHAVTDGGVPVPAAPGVVALLGEQLARVAGAPSLCSGLAVYCEAGKDRQVPGDS